MGESATVNHPECLSPMPQVIGISAVIYSRIIPVHLPREIWTSINFATNALLAVSIPSASSATLR